jgi:hypothetical protein
MNHSALLAAALATPLLVVAVPSAHASAADAAQPALARVSAVAPALQLREAPFPSPLPAKQEVENNGPSGNRTTLVFVGDGYTSAQMPKFRDDVKKQWAALTKLEPYKTYRGFFNAWSVDLVSKVSGVSDDPKGVKRDTPLNMHFWCHGIDRLLCVDDARAQKLGKEVPDADVVFAIANSATYGGAGGPIITVAGDNNLASDITPHEAGHTLGKLADEYGGYGAAKNPAEPDQVNVTAMTAAQLKQKQLKWWRWLGVTAPDGSKIDAYPGGNYYDSGYNRPSKDSNMRTLGKPFDQPSAEQLIKSFYGYVRPIDSSTPDNGDAIYSPRRVEITTPGLAGPDFQIYWALDGKVLAQGSGQRSLDLSKVTLAKGRWNGLTVTVRDTAAAVKDEAFRDSEMTESRSWWVWGG